MKPSLFLLSFLLSPLLFMGQTFWKTDEPVIQNKVSFEVLGGLYNDPSISNNAIFGGIMNAGTRLNDIEFSIDLGYLTFTDVQGLYAGLSLNYYFTRHFYLGAEFGMINDFDTPYNPLMAGGLGYNFRLLSDKRNFTAEIKFMSDYVNLAAAGITMGLKYNFIK